MNSPHSPILCVITDEDTSPLDMVPRALRGGANMIQLRRKTASGRELCRLAEALIPFCRQAGALFIINDRADIALATDADGVHLGQDDLPVAAARQLFGPGKIIGASTSSVDEALKAERNGADYAGFGHIFPTGSKAKGYKPLGPEAISLAAAALRIPLIAIGGITRENAGPLISRGAAGIAVISAVTKAESPEEAARSLMAIMNTTRAGEGT
ncbi:thiamine phosphate synthase [Pelodictyon luteolum]|uniref:Thiamine-phosphate synthase n=1 Tax=Chlorobium luteolum (strain DSM 273 / BCRC 81028 / 2530) TaxID=319225 RepID=THIE_CHLL3|nr:thiamine phosphate synthase [Pelodictyon luteolum]Q3B4B1.1 RecName: Full=Thiamine-phosphate synthase; Short=TP synthase; Short=TPS; AltName: Full=Thiamine-phosphate pyrophosphorylase; Short=TMP pyrophosphorylase; Short=TMP-PPase [Pelodictyon luteolum DSM 273]ABB23820.1 thiamine-phosphate diphosphorylase [Pelodictyon luteolum DSM 273]